MSQKRDPRRGFTMVELMIAVAITAIMAVAIAPLLKVSMGGLTSIESYTVMKNSSQNILARLQQQVTQSKRLFGNTPGDLTFLALADVSTLPGVVSNSQ